MIGAGEICGIGIPDDPAPRRAAVRTKAQPGGVRS